MYITQSLVLILWLTHPPVAELQSETALSSSFSHHLFILQLNLLKSDYNQERITAGQATDLLEQETSRRLMFEKKLEDINVQLLTITYHNLVSLNDGTLRCDVRAPRPFPACTFLPLVSPPVAMVGLCL